ncbi:MAG: NACHT domain-containing protein [Verrucomicrobia bacterium]|nr:NACHT domain-containing protein [Verrucomicrobiota bacterium]
MSNFPLFASSTPMIGRARVFDRMLKDLTKPTPQHLSLVGPRYSGKTVLLAALAVKLREGGSFECVLEWDLGHQTPQSDDEFLASLRRKVSDGLREARRDLFDYLTEGDSGYDELREVIDSLGRDGKRLLMLWDGFDRALHSGQLTRNLWDNLLELCRKPGFVLLTATRRKLQELIRDQKSVSSEFWQVFEVVRLDPFDSSDIEAFTRGMMEHSFESGALSELANWSGGIPPLLVCLLNRIHDDVPFGPVTNEHVNEAACRLGDRATDILSSIWSDCAAPTADLFRLLVEQSKPVFANAGKAERAQLLEMGLAKHAGNKLQLSCRLMRQHVNETKPGSGMLNKLFGSWEDYRTNIRVILERRISQIVRFDETLFHMVQRGIEDIPVHPGVCLNNLTHIEDRALDLIWEKELGACRKLPPEIESYWTESPRDSNKFVSEMMKSDRWEVPGERGPQLALLQLLTGSHQDFKRVMAKHASKDTYVLLNAIHSFRNRTQHADGQEIHLGVAVTAVMLCIELLACLARELLRNNPP